MMPHSSWGGPGLSRTVRIPVAGIPLNVHPELEIIFKELVRRLSEVRARHGRTPLMSSGGYIKRRIRGSLRWSNHSWGLAADFNAGANPYSYVLRYDFPREETQRIANELGFTWGINWKKHDPMHFEYAGSRSDAAALTRRLVGAPAPAPQPAPVRPNPIQEDEMRYPPTLRRGSSGHHVRILQGMLVAVGRLQQRDIDADFGPTTERALIAWQTAARATGAIVLGRRIDVDGVCGPQCWTALLGVG